ncbi:MAG TPA: circularly permuted type 2 ATP-grasp protein, partial [Burkholderiaceae bacterium]|nr:circularly permuted type 2 ATP-grasp protein [Burkholderiaceae bacterium]
MPKNSLQFDAHSQDAAALAAARARPVAPGHFDELRDASGALRAPWQEFFTAIGTWGLADLDRRAAMIARRIRDDGITYNVYSEEGTPQRPWSLDLLPLIIDADAWSAIEQGVVQRATLLTAIMRDAYGEQSLIRDGLLPAALVLGHPGYMRPLAPLAGRTQAGESYLHIIAFDLARGPDGAWRVVTQRTQAPSGLGYALQNRLIVSRLFPEAFRRLRVQRLASSFRRLLDGLVRACPPDDDPNVAPRIVLLTPGPFNETYFEHAYLARYLGIPLVEGSDLTVRDARVFLKTLYGLQRVHGILRRLDDDFCDPLELRPDSTLGVPALLQAVRARQVLIANALGSRFLESPALAGFLPAIARRVLGRDLLLPSLDSWWCGERAAFDEIAPRLSELVIKPTYPPRTTRPGADA